ncbi:conjugative transfer protein [Escherichia coli]|uniref:Conjugative transfer protein n=1 Tax=Escherichia coli TaxID=562 RepID=A0A377HGC3_ECOLX|nr:conjugative transfer protein [Escherichia coli]
MALMALFVLWKDNTTPGQLLVQEIDFVRQTAPAGQFPVRECLPSLHDLPGAEEKICRLPVLLMLQIMSGRLTGH